MTISLVGISADSRDDVEAFLSGSDVIETGDIKKEAGSLSSSTVSQSNA